MVCMGTLTRSDRLHIEVDKKKWLIDAGAPNSHRSILKNKSPGSVRGLANDGELEAITWHR